MDVKFNYIAVEGPIGSGKTSLTNLLGKRLGKSVMLEAPDANPFLGKFYENKKRYALATQLNFLLHRVEQLVELTQMELFGKGAVADFLLDKDPLFAKLNLGDDEFALYRQIYHHVKPKTPVPDLVIYLQASPGMLIERVRSRGKSYEKQVTQEYLSAVFYEYQNFFHSYDVSPLLIVNSENLNFVDNAVHFEMLLERISGMRGPREFFGLGR